MKFVKGRWFPLIISIIAALAVGIVLFFCGFRITYVPELESSWDAISAVAAWCGVLASFLAIWFAILIPKTIADEQNKVSLFEKRYEAYSSILLLEVFADAVNQEIFSTNSTDYNGQLMELPEKVKLYCMHFATTLGYSPRLHNGSIDAESVTQSISLVKQYETKAMMLPLLIYKTDDEANKMKKALSDIFEPLLCFVVEIVTFKFDEHDSINDENREKFVAAVKKFKLEYADKIEGELLIKTR